MILEFAELSRVICDIYDASVDPLLWPKALGTCCAFLDAFRVTLFWHDTAAVEASALYHFNDDPYYTRLYEQTYVGLNPLFPAAAFLSPGQVIAVTDLVPRAELEQTRFFQEWVKPQGITATFGAMLENEALRGAFISFHWNGVTADDDTRERLALLVPHLQRAVAIGRLFAYRQRTETALTTTLDQLDSPVLLLGSGGRIVLANQVARNMIAQGLLLHARRDIVSVVDQAADRQLKLGLGEIEKGAAAGSPGVTIVLSEAPDHRWIANVLPLVDGARRQAGQPGEAIAAVFVRNSVHGTPPPLETLARRYKLTASELRVLDAVARVSGLDAVAETLGISRATVKTHLNRIYRKCGAKNQSDLIRLIAGMGGKS